MNEQGLEKLIEMAIQEDIGSGDITTEATISTGQKADGFIIAKEKGIIYGLDIAKKVFEYINKKVIFTKLKEDGDRINNKTRVAKIEGNVSYILKAERTALNFLGHLSGITTETSRYVEKVRGTKAQILDTRKTTPGMRYAEKMAVQAGGGINHRMGLYDMILIKENHISAAGSIDKAIKKALDYKHSNNLDVKIEIETTNLKEVEKALQYPVDVIMLDNFDIEDTINAVKITSGKMKLESSGNVNLGNVRKIAETGVDYISVGAITHSVKSFDFSLLLNI